MDRFTKIISGTKDYVVENSKVTQNENGFSGEAIQRLGQFESIYDNLLLSQIEISNKLEQLRNEGKKNSVQFRELMGKKLTNSYIISTFVANGLL